MKIVLAPDSFKGTLSSMEIIDHLERAARACFDPVEIVKVPIADGGRRNCWMLWSRLPME